VKKSSLLFFRLQIDYATSRPCGSYEVLNGQKGVLPQYEVGSRTKDTLLYISQYSLTLKLNVAPVLYDDVFDSHVPQ